MYTRHGHLIPGTVGEAANRPPIARCGGVHICQQCKDDVAAYSSRVHLVEATEEAKNILSESHAEDPVLKAKFMLCQAINDRSGNIPGIDEMVSIDMIRLVHFCYILGGWKAMMISLMHDHMYYEITYNIEARETYIDAYSKTANVCIPD